MNKRSFLRSVVTLFVTAVISFAADVSGKYKTSFTTPDGQTREGTMTLKADGEKLTGSVSGRQGNEIEISEGKVSGDGVSFVVVRNFNGNEVKINYKGKLVGNEIKFTVDFGQGSFEMTAKKAE
jgi:hypothetical protein